MVFWEKGKTGRIKNDLKDLKKKVRSLPSLEMKKKRSKTVIKRCISDLNDAKKDINARRDEEKAKPFIDVRFNADIDQLADDEIKEADKLKEELKEYSELFDLASSEDELDKTLEMLESETDNIISRENNTKNKINDMETQTLVNRLRAPVDKIPAKRTQDGVPFKNIATVGVQLGAVKVEVGTKHTKIHMPNGDICIVSPDSGSQLTAKQMRRSLSDSLPENKLPTVHKLEHAFKKGDIRAA